MMAERPGIMLYFDLAEPLKSLGYEGKGKLLEAMLDYGQHGIVPDFGSDGMLQLTWGFLRPKLDADAAHYREKVLKNTYSSYCARVRKSNAEPLCFEDWVAERHRTAPIDLVRSPTTAPTSTPATISKSTTTADVISETDITGKINTTGDRGGKGEKEPAPSVDFDERRKKCREMLEGLSP